MNNDKFYALLEKMVLQERETMVGKGREYTIGSDDKLANFKNVARDCGLTPLQVWFVYASKHWASICNFVKDGVEASNEPIDGRIMDMRNYLALMQAIVQENRQPKIPDDEIPF